MTEILVVDDEKDIRGLICDILEDEGYATRRAASASECMAALDQSLPDLLILDIWLKDSELDGIDILMRVKKMHPHIPVVIISGHGNIEIAVEAIKQGAYDYIEKPFNIDQLIVVVRRAVEASSLRQENNKLKTGGGPIEILGDSPVMRVFKGQLTKVTEGRGRVVLKGGSGVGKDLTARFIHQQSTRFDQPFVMFDCASHADDDLEVTLFGAEERGAILRKGVIEQANGGTLYLDHLDALPLSIQPKLVRFLVDNAITRRGGLQAVPMDVRVMSSTTQDLDTLVEQGQMQSDFYHRINVVPMEVPSLSERREDIPALVEHFVSELSETHGLRPRAFSEAALQSLEVMRWPGNLRQLRNFIERILILADGMGEITPDDFPNDGASHASDGPDMSVPSHLVALPLREAREVFEREYLLAQIERFSGNISKTAGFVGMERSALHRKLKTLGVVSGQK